MFDAILDLKRRRMMQMGLPQVTGNIQPPQVGPDIEAPPPPQPMQMMQTPMEQQPTDPNMNTAASLGGQRAMELLLRRMKPKETDEGASPMRGLPILKNLFRRSPTS